MLGSKDMIIFDNTIIVIFYYYTLLCFTFTFETLVTTFSCVI